MKKEYQKKKGSLNNTRGGYFLHEGSGGEERRGEERGGRKEGKGSCRFTGQRGERFGSLETPKIGIIK